MYVFQLREGNSSVRRCEICNDVKSIIRLGNDSLVYVLSESRSNSRFKNSARAKISNDRDLVDLRVYMSGRVCVLRVLIRLVACVTGETKEPLKGKTQRKQIRKQVTRIQPRLRCSLRIVTLSGCSYLSVFS